MELKCHEVRLFHEPEHGLNNFAIEVPAAALAEWCLHLTLLLLKGVDSLSVGPSSDGFVLEVRNPPYAAASHSHRGTFRYLNSTVDICLPREQIESWIWLGLQHLYRQYTNRGYTDHIDTELDASAGTGDVLDLSIFVV